ncbi:MAG: Alanine-tRNA ligase, partial [Microgenomates group bacterium GW2011_GWC1_49_7]
LSRGSKILHCRVRPAHLVAYFLAHQLDSTSSYQPRNKISCLLESPNCQCGRFMEIANSVFMQYVKQADGSLTELKQKSVDFGGGLERLVAATNNDPDIFNIDIFVEAKKILDDVNLAGDVKNIRVILDHIRAAMFIIDAGVQPSNKEQGYILRRLIRRAAVHSKIANIVLNTNLILILRKLGESYSSLYPSIATNRGQIHQIISDELVKFESSLEKGMKMIGKTSQFDLFQTYGFPPEIIEELFRQKGLSFDKEEFGKEFKKHQELSRTAAKGMFKGGLADASEQTTKLHTAHHLLLAALQKIVDPNIKQRGSNITAERLRMDFNFVRKVTPEELKKVEELVNEKIKEDLKVERVEMKREEAEQIGVQMEFGHKYPDRVSVYFVGPRDDFFSAEFCGGPHVARTGVIGTFHILKEESAGAGVRRIYAAAQ